MVEMTSNIRKTHTSMSSKNSVKTEAAVGLTDIVMVKLETQTVPKKVLVEESNIDLHITVVGIVPEVISQGHHHSRGKNTVEEAVAFKVMGVIVTRATEADHQLHLGNKTTGVEMVISPSIRRNLVATASVEVVAAASVAAEVVGKVNHSVVAAASEIEALSVAVEEVLSEAVEVLEDLLHMVVEGAEATRNHHGNQNILQEADSEEDTSSPMEVVEVVAVVTKAIRVTTTTLQITR